MHGGGDEWRQRRVDELGALDRNAALRSDHCLGRRRSEADDRARLDHADIRFEPWAAGCDLGGVRLLMDAAFAARLPFEMLDDVRNVDGLAIDARFREGFVEQRAGRTDEGMAAQIFLIAGLLADEHDRRGLLPLAEDRLRAGPPEIAGLAAGGDDLQFLQRRTRRNQRSGGFNSSHDSGESAIDDPTQVNCLLKSTPSILPRERRTRFCARIGFASSSGRRNIMRISIFTPPPSAACNAGSYSIFSCTHHACRSAAGIASRSAAVGSTFPPP